MKSKHNIQILLALSQEELESIMAKKTKGITKKEKQKHKAYFEGEKGIFIIEKLAIAIIKDVNYQKP